MRHELHLSAAGLKVMVLALIPMTLGAALVAGPAGAASVLLPAAIMTVNHVLLAASTGWSRVLKPSVAAVGYAGFVFRMFGVFFAFAWAASIPWVHRGLFATAFCATLAVTLGAECFSYTRKSYVPRWRLTS